jgi:hypothetical protein
MRAEDASARKRKLNGTRYTSRRPTSRKWGWFARWRGKSGPALATAMHYSSMSHPLLLSSLPADISPGKTQDILQVNASPDEEFSDALEDQLRAAKQLYIDAFVNVRTESFMRLNIQGSGESKMGHNAEALEMMESSYRWFLMPHEVKKAVRLGLDLTWKGPEPGIR